MVLSAIKDDRSLVTPYELLDKMDLSDAYELIRRGQRKGEQFFCADCYRATGQKIPVRFRGTDAEQTRPHFFHAGDESSKCPHRSGESEKHRAAKSRIAGILKTKGEIDVSLEQWLDSEGIEKNRRPDILASYPNGSYEAHEIQISAINSDELASRTTDIQSHLQQLMAAKHGVSIDGMNSAAHRPAGVVWYLYGRNYNRENREWAEKMSGVIVKRLWFDDEGTPHIDEYKKIGEDKLTTKASGSSKTCQYAPSQTKAVPKQSTTNWPITNAKGWHGRIVDRPSTWARWKPLETGQKSGDTKMSILADVVYVQWKERKDAPGGDVLSHRPDEVWAS